MLIHGIYRTDKQFVYLEDKLNLINTSIRRTHELQMAYYTLQKVYKRNMGDNKRYFKQSP